MANEIDLVLRVRVANGLFRHTFDPGPLKIDQSAVGGHAPVVSVGTAEEDLSLGDIATAGLVAVRNLDDTNFITFGPSSGGVMVPLGRIHAGEPALLRLDPSPGVTLRWKANGAPVLVQVAAFEN